MGHKVAGEKVSSDKPGYARPGFVMRRIVGPIMVRGGRFPVLSVVGRSSGQIRQVPIGEPVERQGRSYLLSGRGPTQWILNLRAAGRGTLRMGGRTLSFKVVEVTGAERDQVIAAYRAKFGASVDPFFARLPDAADHPTFRLEWEAQ
jgi:deazaflavin-dependent oxidoreductase (nitroreductase family)